MWGGVRNCSGGRGQGGDYETMVPVTPEKTPRLSHLKHQGSWVTKKKQGYKKNIIIQKKDSKKYSGGTTPPPGDH